MDLQGALEAAWSRRAALHADGELDAYRLFHGGQDGIAGLKVDRYGDAALLTCKPEVDARVEQVVAALDGCRRFGLVVARSREAGVRVVRGEMPGQPLVVSEHGLRFLVEPHRPANPGLFLDARPARAWIRAQAAGRRVLNLFAFTGSLG